MFKTFFLLDFWHIDSEVHEIATKINLKKNKLYILLIDDFSELAKEQAICYITALQWILDYYYRGVQSWDWYYPHHYAPFISDLKDFQDHEIKFNLGKPFLPFQQVGGAVFLIFFSFPNDELTLFH